MSYGWIYDLDAGKPVPCPWHRCVCVVCRERFDRPTDIAEGQVHAHCQRDASDRVSLCVKCHEPIRPDDLRCQIGNGFVHAHCM